MAWKPKCTDQNPNYLGRERLMHKSDSRKFREDLKNNNNSTTGTESAEESEFIKKALLEQPLQDFEETLKSAARLKIVSKEDTKDDTTKLLMDLLEKKEKKPVSYDGENIEFIDDKVEEAVIVDQRARAQYASFRGTAKDELRTLEEGNRELKQRNGTCDENEQKKFTSSSSVLAPDVNILGPVSHGMFTSFKTNAIGCDLLQRNRVRDDLGLFDSTKTLNTTSPVEDKKDEKIYTKAKGGRGSKKTKKEHVYTVEQKETKAERSLEEILFELGETPDPKTAATGKNKNKNKNNNKNNKNKGQQQQQEQKNQNQKQQQQKNNNNKNEKVDEKKMIEHPEEDKPAAPVNSKRSSSGPAGSWEDAEEEFLSADEDVGGSNSRLTTPPTEFVDARTTRDEGLSDVMNDPSNYRDDEEVELLAKRLQQEDEEFITVGKNNKKKKNMEQQQPTDKRTGSACEERSTSRNSPQTSNNRRFSAHGGDNKGANNNNGPNNTNNRRPIAPATTFGDYLENTKKDTHKKHKKPLTVSNQQQNQINIKKDDEASTFVDAVETSSPIAVNTTPSSTQASAFSYADAAKKSSGENTPQHELSPVPHQNSATTSAFVEVGGSPPSDVQLPGDFTASTPSDVTFGYDDTDEDKKREQKKKLKQGGSTEKVDGVDLVMALGGKAYRFPKPAIQKGSASNTPRNQAILSTFAGLWEQFSKDTPPVVFKPKQKK